MTRSIVRHHRRAKAIMSYGPAPVFMMGGTRAERELLQALIEPQADLSFAPESDTLARLVGDIAKNWPVLAYEGYPEQYWFKSAAESYGAARAARAAAEGKTRWVECLDATTLSLETIDRLFPNCQMLHLVSGSPFERGGLSIRRAARSLSAGRYSEVSLRNLRTYPTVVRRFVLDCLDRPAGRLAAA